MKVIANKKLISFSKNPYLTDTVQGYWLKLGNLEQAVKFKTDEEAINFIKAHSLNKKDYLIIDIE